MTREEIQAYGMKITQSSPTQLVVLTYEIIEKYLNDAIKAYKDNDEETFLQNSKKAKEFLNQLMSSLDMKYGISADLMKIYVFINNRLVKDMINHNADEYLRYIDIIEKLRVSFAEIEGEDSRGPVMENTQQVYAGLTYSKSSLNENVYSDMNRGFTV